MPESQPTHALVNLNVIEVLKAQLNNIIVSTSVALQMLNSIDTFCIVKDSQDGNEGSVSNDSNNN